MDVPLEIAFVDMDSSEFVENRIRERVARLETRNLRLVSCRVAIEIPHQSHRKGNLYHVRIEMGVPGKELVISRAPGDINAHNDVYVAIDDAFEAAERLLAEDGRKAKGDVKLHEGGLQGRVTRLFGEQGHGFIATTDGREIYFHRNSVVDGDFSDLEEGQTVELVLVHGESPMGPQATMVRPIGGMRFDPAPPKH
jgi:cold shock CspA family protein